MVCVDRGTFRFRFGATHCVVMRCPAGFGHRPKVYDAAMRQKAITIAVASCLLLAVCDSAGSDSDASTTFATPATTAAVTTTEPPAPSTEAPATTRSTWHPPTSTPSTSSPTHSPTSFAGQRCCRCEHAVESGVASRTGDCLGDGVVVSDEIELTHGEPKLLVPRWRHTRHPRLLVGDSDQDLPLGPRTR